MNKSEAEKRVKKLRKEIRKHRYNYHVLDKTTLSPEALDSLKKELFDLEQEFPDLVTPDSPTQRIGGKPLDEFEKVEHVVPMLSFNDVFNEGDLRDWLKRLNNHLDYDVRDKDWAGFFVELKFDGLAVELVYEDGKFIQGSTRGNGKIGEDVTQNLKTVEAIPLRLETARPPRLSERQARDPSASAEPRDGGRGGGRGNRKPKTGNQKFRIPERLVVRGEVLMPKENFEKLNQKRKEKGEKPYANPRNVAAGTVRQLDPKVVAERSLDFFAYDIAVGVETETHDKEHEALKQLGFKVDHHGRRLDTLEEVVEHRNEWEDKRDELDFEIDGVVVRVNDNSLYEAAGVVGKAPRGAIAFKFSPREATTKIVDIKIQVGRTGALTPVAVLSPVEVGGVTIAHASLHNADQIERLDVRIGDTVVVSRAGDVIPQVTKVLDDMRDGSEEKFVMPDRCPIDDSKVVRDGAIHRCSNPQCGARNREALAHFVSRSAFDIEGVGPKIIDRFLDEGLIADFADLFELEEGDIEVLEGFGKKSAENLIRELEESKTITLPRFLYSLGIVHVGSETAQLIAEEIASVSYYKRRLKKVSDGKVVSGPKKVVDIMRGLSMEDWRVLEDIGPEMAESIYDWLREPHNIDLVERMEEVGIKVAVEKLQKSSKFEDTTFVLTGALKNFTRDEAKEKIKQLGGKVTSSVSGNTDFLVAGESPGSSKMEDAKEENVNIVDEDKFLRILEE